MVSVLGESRSLADLAQEYDLEFFLVSYVDLLGGMRAKLVPASQAAGLARNGACFAPFASNLGLGPDVPDIVAIPDPDSLIILPWRPAVAWVASDVYYCGKPFAAAPRTILKKALQQAAGRGYTLKTGVEAEFFLLKEEAGSYQVADARDTAGRPCYDQGNLMRQFDLISTLVKAMENLGWGPYQCDHEDANGQFEINWTYSDALTTADRHAFFKYMVKTLAEQQGLTATFMPKPFGHLTGNGAHLHISLWDGEQNLFDDPQGELGLSAAGYAFLAGVMAHARGLAALCNPTVNSYKRLQASSTTSGATWSPRYVSYGANNRTHLIRIPEGGRFECRMIDGAANLYLAEAGLVAAGLAGMDGGLHPGQRLDENMFTRGLEFPGLTPLPATLLEALHALTEDDLLMATLGDLGAKIYLDLKYQEWDAYKAQVSAWELTQYVNC
ncbi:MAG: type III glutamate--ammonia ligase [Gloeomargaritaceae cyanobacterium C42_A2020_066]|nr:type III glutamate--ammonia ligase [Gloeomargaritaceae cyanobacterium C42_A2020_066]